MKSPIFTALRVLVFMCIVCVGGCAGGGSRRHSAPMSIVRPAVRFSVLPPAATVGAPFMIYV
jgi:hypothetical protein